MQFQRRGHTQGVFYRHGKLKQFKLRGWMMKKYTNISCVWFRPGAHALLHTLTTEGPFALYRGLFIRLFYVVPSAAINFTIYDQLKTSLFGNARTTFLCVCPRWHIRRLLIFVGEGSWNNVVYTVILGGLSRIVQTGVRTPFDVVKQQMQVQGIFTTALCVERRRRTKKRDINESQFISPRNGRCKVSCCCVSFGKYKRYDQVDWQT